MKTLSPGSVLAQTGRETVRRAPGRSLRLGRVAIAAAGFGVLVLALMLASPAGIVPELIHRLGSVLFGRLAWLAAAVSAGWAMVMFRDLVRAYRRMAGFPWGTGLSFAASALACLMALHACLS